MASPALSESSPYPLPLKSSANEFEICSLIVPGGPESDPNLRGDLEIVRSASPGALREPNFRTVMSEREVAPPEEDRTSLVEPPPTEADDEGGAGAPGGPAKRPRTDFLALGLVRVDPRREPLSDVDAPTGTSPPGNPRRDPLGVPVLDPGCGGDVGAAVMATAGRAGRALSLSGFEGEFFLPDAVLVAAAADFEGETFFPEDGLGEGFGDGALTGAGAEAGAGAGVGGLAGVGVAVVGAPAGAAAGVATIFGTGAAALGVGAGAGAVALEAVDCVDGLDDDDDDGLDDGAAGVAGVTGLTVAGAFVAGVVVATTVGLDAAGVDLAGVGVVDGFAPALTESGTTTPPAGRDQAEVFETMLT